jgi:hypothetical protein
MTEAEWLGAIEPNQMLRFLRDAASARKLRLFAVACFHRLQPKHAANFDTRQVDAIEGLAEGKLSLDESVAAYQVAAAVPHGPHSTQAFYGRFVPYALNDSAWEAAHRASAAVCVWVVWRARRTPPDRPSSEESGTFARLAERTAHAALLRDIVGSPFARAPRIAPAIVAWNSGAVSSLAATIYAERSFDRLPLLADALEDAGCTDAELLGHLRGPGPHVRGCWAVDLVIGKS